MRVDMTRQLKAGLIRPNNFVKALCLFTSVNLQTAYDDLDYLLSGDVGAWISLA